MREGATARHGWGSRTGNTPVLSGKSSREFWHEFATVLDFSYHLARMRSVAATALRVRLFCTTGTLSAAFLLVIAFQTAPEDGIVWLQLQGPLRIGDGQIPAVLFGVDQRQVA